MKRATISLGHGDFDRTTIGLVCAGLHIQVDEQRFPNEAWTDFVIVVLAWWCRALAQLLNAQADHVEVRFMEGPYLAVVGPLSEHSVRLQLVETGPKRAVRVDANVLAGALIESLLAASARALEECKAHDWWSSDADELGDARGALATSYRHRVLHVV